MSTIPDNSMRHRGSSLAVVLGCLVILILLVVGLWLASRFAKDVISDTRQQGLSMKQTIARSTRDGMEEARRAGESEAEAEPEPETHPETALLDDARVTPTLDEQTKTQWLSRVNEFIMEEVLTAQSSGTEAGRSLTLREALDQAVEKLDAGGIDQPAVEAAIRTTLASSYLSLDLHENASWQCASALETLRRGFGAGHPYTAQAMRNLAALHVAEGRFDTAADLLDTLYEIRHATEVSPSDEALRHLDIIRLLRSATPARAVGLDRRQWPDSVLDLLEQPPPCCTFKPLEF